VNSEPFLVKALFSCLWFLVIGGTPGESGGSPIILRFGGDCLLADHYDSDGADVTRAFSQLWHLSSADLAMVNLECPITQRGAPREKPFTFRMNPRNLAAFSTAGIDLVTIANNHVYDYDSVGLFDTLRNLDSAGIAHVGAGMNSAEARRPVIRSFGGTRIAFLAYYSGGEAPVATGTSPGVAERSLGVIQDDVRRLRTGQMADIIVANIHWGVEKETLPEPDQMRFAHAMVDMGVDVVVGHHPHVLQPIERYHNGVIAYSLGNLVFGGNSRSSYDTALLEIEIRGRTATHRIIPVRVENYAARLLEGPPAFALIDSLETLSRSLTHE